MPLLEPQLLPKPWQQSGALIMTLVSVMAATVLAMVWAGSQVDRVATAKAKEAIAPVQAQLDVHKATEDTQHAWDGERLTKIEQKLDVLLERGERR